MESVHVEQVFENVELSQVFSRVADLKAEGYRLGQICGVVLDDETYEIIYSFDKGHELLNLKLDIPTDAEVESITKVYWPAFIYENEIHDLFGVRFKHSELDYGGTFFKVSEETPWKPNKKEGGEE